MTDRNPDILNQALIKKSLAPVFALGKASHLLKQYVGQDLSELDKRLLKGFYVADASELINDDAQDHNKIDFSTSKKILQKYKTFQSNSKFQ